MQILVLRVYVTKKKKKTVRYNNENVSNGIKKKMKYSKIINFVNIILI